MDEVDYLWLMNFCKKRAQSMEIVGVQMARNLITEKTEYLEEIARKHEKREEIIFKSFEEEVLI